MNFFYKTKGVISIFLIIIMLPLFTSAVLLVDGTRYQSAKMMAQEAGDLAAYSTIANYDVNLKDQYGLFAIDDVDKAAKNFEKYFRESLGYSASESKEYSKIVQDAISNSLFKDGKYKNSKFFNMYNFEIGTSNVSPEHPLSVPSVLQNQIVEYSKYRALETILERFEIINALDKLSEEEQKNEKIAAKMSDMSELDTMWGGIAPKVKSLKELIADYNKMLASYAGVQVDDFKTASDSSFVKMYENACTKEFLDLARKTDVITKTRNTYKFKFENKGSELLEKYDEISSLADSIKFNAENALTDYRGKLDYYKDDPELCDDIRETIEILEKLVSTNKQDEKYSVNGIRNSLIRPNTYVDDAKTRVDKLEQSFAKTYQEYNEEYKKKKEQLDADDTLSAEEKKEQLAKIGYNIYRKDGSEWIVTANDEYLKKPYSESMENNTMTIVTEYDVWNYLRRNAKQFKIYDFENYYEVKANQKKESMKGNFSEMPSDMKEQDKEYVKGKVDEANKEKKSNYNDEKNVTLDDSVYNSLPSKTYNYKNSGGKDTSKEISNANIESKDASKMIKDTSKSVSLVSSLLESGRNDILTYCYIFEMLNTRLSETEFKKPNDVSEKYLVDWRYNGLEKDFRDRVKKDNPAVFRTNEVEYVFAGNKSETVNATIVYSWIYGTRLINNLVAVYSSNEAKAECEMLAAASSAATLGTVPISVFKWIYIAAWAAFETGKELSMLIDGGYKIPLIKTGKNLFISHFWKTAESCESLLRYNRPSSFNVSYEDYLLVMLCFVGREKRLLRVADIIQLNMPLRGGSSDFKMSNSYTYIAATTGVRIKYLFQPIAQFTSSYKGTGLKFTNEIHQGY